MSTSEIGSRLGLAAAAVAKNKDMITKELFDKVHSLISKHVEGGYYHPDMKKKMSAANQAKMEDSGETHLGIDRKHGRQLSIYPEWSQFWALIDADRAKNPALWKHYYMGGALYEQLHKLAGEMMFKWFNVLLRRYVSLSAYDELAADPRLAAHMIYAAWNGEGWFRRFARELNNAVVKYEGNKDKIFEVAFAVRQNSSNEIIRQQAVNLKPVFKEFNSIP